MDISLFDYDYPDELIAQYPLPNRNASRLMVIDPTQKTWEHSRFRNFTNHFGPDDLLVFNDVRVMPSRLYGQASQGRKIEVLLLDQKSESEWQCLVRPASKLKNGEKISFGNQLQGVLSGEKDQWFIRLSVVGAIHELPLQNLIAEIGLPPLPPYIKRKAPFETKAEDVRRYQTVYARNGAGAAAPTAGFHFTDELMKQLKEKGCEIAFCTLHVGRDTFQPVRCKKIEDHPMHGESYTMPPETLKRVMSAKREGRRVTAIGTTTVRTLESAWDSVGAGPGHTQKFIYPGYTFKIVDRLLTNFHQPKSTLLMLISAFAGRKFIIEAYQEAIREHYRLFSFGDAMLILNKSL